MSQKVKAIILVLFPLIIAVTASYILEATILFNEDKVTAYLSSFGPLIFIAYIVLQTLTVVIAPLGGFFLFIIMAALYGPAVALVMAYIVVTPAYLLNFLLARKYGRPFVERVIGKSSLKKFDNVAQDAGILTLIVLRVFQSMNFDYLSYAIGLTKVDFKVYAVVNILGGIPGSLIAYYIMSKFDNLTLSVLALFALTGIFTLISVLINKKLKSKKLLNEI